MRPELDRQGQRIEKLEQAAAWTPLQPPVRSNREPGTRPVTDHGHHQIENIEQVAAEGRLQPPLDGEHGPTKPDWGEEVER